MHRDLSSMYCNIVNVRMLADGQMQIKYMVVNA